MRNFVYSSGSTVIGVFYMDHKDKGVFGDSHGQENFDQYNQAQEFASTICSGCLETGLIDELEQVVRELKELGPHLRIYGNLS
jgi:hypothetical protein